jgi:hypothetical protein
MRPIRRLVVGLLLAGATLVLPASALAADPCTPGQFGAADAAAYTGMAFKYTPHIPEEITAGRPTPIQINTAYGRETDPIAATLIRQDGQTPAHPFTRDYPVATDTAKAVQTIAVTLEKSDGPAAIQISFTYAYADEAYCRATVVSSWIGTSDPELTLRGGVRRVHDIYKNNGRTQGILIPTDTSRCGPQPAKLTATFSGRTITLSTTNLCQFLTSGSTRASSSGLRIRSQGTEGYDIWVTRPASFAGNVTYRLSYGGASVASGSFRVTSRRSGGHYVQRVTKIR